MKIPPMKAAATGSGGTACTGEGAVGVGEGTGEGAVGVGEGCGGQSVNDGGAQGGADGVGGGQASYTRKRAIAASSELLSASNCPRLRANLGHAPFPGNARSRAARSSCA